jgi:hypothetical protein
VEWSRPERFQQREEMNSGEGIPLAQDQLDELEVRLMDQMASPEPFVRGADLSLTRSPGG